MAARLPLRELPGDTANLTGDVPDIAPRARVAWLDFRGDRPEMVVMRVRRRPFGRTVLSGSGDARTALARRAVFLRQVGTATPVS